ncbi:hypothetical protein WN943_024714 [Citrus x changshan-huyou]
MKGEESLPDLEIGTQLYAVDRQNLSQFFEEVAAIKIDMEDITNLYINIQRQNEDTKSAQSSKILGGIGDKIKVLFVWEGNMGPMMKRYVSIFKRLIYLGYLGYLGYPRYPSYPKHSGGTSGTP